jgi:hypothetical protein
MAEPLGPLLLSWLPNTDADLAGYKLYMGRASGSYGAPGSPINVGNTTSYTVNITEGGFWYFAVTAYDTSANESGFSDEIVVEFIIPIPTIVSKRNIFQVNYR